MANISSITTGLTSLAGLLLVTPQSTVGYQPQNQPINGSSIPLSSPLPTPILFHYEGEQTAFLESDITDHYVEDNTAVQDQIALRPVTITTQGFIGELNDVAPQILAQVQNIANKLVSINGYTPGLSQTALIAYNEAFFAYQIAQTALLSAVSAAATISNLINGSANGGEAVIDGNGIEIPGSRITQTKQQIVFQQFFGYWNSRTLFTIQSPWAIFENMAIKSLRAIQDADTRMITDFEVTFKLMRFVNSVEFSQNSISLFNVNTAQGQLISQIQSANPTNIGTQTLTTSSTAFPYV